MFCFRACLHNYITISKHLRSLERQGLEFFKLSVISFKNDVFKQLIFQSKVENYLADLVEEDAACAHPFIFVIKGVKNCTYSIEAGQSFVKNKAFWA